METVNSRPLSPTSADSNSLNSKIKLFDVLGELTVPVPILAALSAAAATDTGPTKTVIDTARWA